MNPPAIPLLDALRARMSWLSSRQNVLSQNVANADTPAYQAQDLKPLDFENLLKANRLGATGLTVTDPRHIQIASETSPYQTQEADDATANPNGNTVSLEEEMMKVADTQAQYQVAANLYSKSIAMMKTALDRSGG